VLVLIFQSSRLYLVAAIMFGLCPGLTGKCTASDQS
jgi:hypothetical protein